MIVAPNDKPWTDAIADFLTGNPKSMNIFGCSIYSDATNKTDYDKWLNEQKIKDFCNSNNLILFAAGTNIETDQ